MKRLLFLLLLSTEAWAQSPVMHPITSGADITITLPASSDTLIGQNTGSPLYSGSVPSLDWINRILWDSSNYQSIDYQNKILYSVGSPIANWGTNNFNVETKLGIYSNGVHTFIQGSNSQYVGDINWYLPPDNGSSGYVLTTNGSGNLSWGTAPTGPEGPQGPQGNNGSDGRYQGVNYPLADYGSNYISLQYNDSITVDSNYLHLVGEETGYPVNYSYLYSSDTSNSRGWHPPSSISWSSMSGPSGMFINGSGFLSYTNGQSLIDGSGNMFTANNNYLVNSSGFLSWTNGNTFMDNSFNLFSDNGTQFTLPTTQGATQSVLVNDGSGNTSWSAKAFNSSTSTASATCSVSCATSPQVLVSGGCANTQPSAMQSSFPASTSNWSCVYADNSGDCTATIVCQ